MREAISIENAIVLNELGAVKAGWITQVAWSPSGLMTAIAGADGTRLYVGTFGGKPTHVLSGHGGHVKAIAFSPDSALLASVASDTTVKLWDIRDAENNPHELAILTGHTDSIDAVAFRPDGSTLATGSADGSIQLWEMKNGNPTFMLKGHEREVTGLAYALDGNVLVSGSWDGTVRLWDAQSETQGTVLGYHDDWVRDVVVSPAGTMVASVSKDATVRLWDAHSGEAYASIYAHEGGVDCVAFSPDGALMATGGRDHKVRVWGTQDVLMNKRIMPDQALARIDIHQKPVMSVAFNPAGTLLTTASGDNTVRLWGIG